MNRITFISTLDDYWGGSEELWTRTAVSLVNSGEEVHVIAYSSLFKNERIQDLKKIGISVHKVSSDLNVRERGILARIVNNTRKRYSPAYKYNTCLRYQNSTLVISQSNTFDILLNEEIRHLLLSNQFDYWLICQFNFEHHVIPSDLFEQGQILFEKASGIIFLSERNRSVAEHQLAMRLPRAHVLSNPLNLESTEYIDYPESTIFKVACVARLDAEIKCQDILIQILSIPKWSSRPIELHFYGIGDDQEYLMRLADFYRINKKIFFHGYEKNVRKIWSLNQLLILTSIGEGKPLVVQEAMICGRSAVVTDVGGNGELIEDGETGFVSRGTSILLVEETIERAWNKRSTWKNMGEKARKWALENVDLKPQEKIAQLVLKH